MFATRKEVLCHAKAFIAALLQRRRSNFLRLFSNFRLNGQLETTDCRIWLKLVWILLLSKADFNYRGSTADRASLHLDILRFLYSHAPKGVLPGAVMWKACSCRKSKRSWKPVRERWKGSDDSKSIGTSTVMQLPWATTSVFLFFRCYKDNCSAMEAFCKSANLCSGPMFTQNRGWGWLRTLRISCHMRFYIAIHARRSWVFTVGLFCYFTDTWKCFW